MHVLVISRLGTLFIILVSSTRNELFTSILFNKRQFIFAQGCGTPPSRLVIQYGLATV